MHLVKDSEGLPVESTEQLVDYFRAACKPAVNWRLGTEYEVIGVSVGPGDFAAALPYEGDRGIGAVLGHLATKGWAPVVEKGTVIALVRSDSQVTVEPGGQLELANRPVSHTDTTRDDLNDYIAELADPTCRYEIAWLGVGFRPFGRLQDVPWMPKERYALMREHLPRRGKLAHEMMKRTATVQVNLDYSDADDALAKVRGAMSVTSILTALYANSPVVDGQLSGYQSYRSFVWWHTDPDRCGLLPLAYADGDIFANYVEWALDVPMIFVYRNGYRAVDSMTFRQFMREGFAGVFATLDDWALHLSTLFPEARLKQFMEVRGCDSGSIPMALSLGPLCRGLFYDRDALTAATGLTAHLSFSSRVQLSTQVARDGLRARVPGKGWNVGDLARELVAIAAEGLERQQPEELPYLLPVREIAATGRTQADALIELWSETRGDPRAVIAKIGHRPPC